MHASIRESRDVIRPVLTLILAIIISVQVFDGPASAGGVDINTLVQQTQKMSSDPNKLKLIWWMPKEFWQASFTQSPGTTEEQTEALLKGLRPYMIFMAVDADIGPFGGADYRTRTEIRKNMILVDREGGRYYPLADDVVDPDTKNLLSIMKPILRNMLGPMGENMHFVVFPSTDGDGRMIAEAAKEGGFAVELGGEKFLWRLPLGSLLPPKVCPVDGAELDGSWRYCPWHGDELIEKGRTVDEEGRRNEARRSR